MSLLRRVLLLVVLLGALLIPAQAFADGESLVPPPPGPASTTGGDASTVYDDPNYKYWNYTFDRYVTSGNMSVPTEELKNRLNTLLVFKAWLMKVAIRIVQYALAQDFLNTFLDRAAPVIGAVGKALWDGEMPWVIMALAVAGLSAMLLYIRGLTTRVWGLLGGTALILVVMASTIAPAADGTHIAGVDSVKLAVTGSRDLALSVYSAASTAAAGSTGKGLAATGSDAAWKALVLDPWVTGNFGAPLNKEGWDFYLTKPPAARQAAGTLCTTPVAAGQVAQCPFWGNEGDDHWAERGVVAVASLIFTVVYAGALFALAGGMIIAQLWFVLLVILLPVWLLVALWWPETGPVLAQRIGFKALGVLISQTVLAAALAALLLLTQSVVAVFPDRGWVLQAVLIDALAILAFQFRFTWLSPFSLRSPHRQPVEAGGALRQIRSWVGRRSRSEISAAERAAEAVAAVAASREPMPVFPALKAPEVTVEAPPATLDALVARPQAADLPLRQRPPQEAFLSQMRVLRQQMGMKEAPAVAGTAVPPGPGGWEEPSPTAPPSSGSARAVERSGREAIPEAARASRQRPRA